MESTVKTDWKGNMAFEWNVKGFKLMIDADENVGGENKGPQPKPFMLAALGGCTGMDVISILNKMKITPLLTGFSVDVTGKLTDEHPKHYHSMHLVYSFKPLPNTTLDINALQKAIDLSLEKYCGVGAVYRKAGISMTTEIQIL
jgi:putative redox protein